MDLVGSASILKMKKGCDKTVVIRKGELLPGTKYPVRLQADNFGIRFADLQQDWSLVINYISSHQPPALDDYPNPYTGETYRTLFPDDYPGVSNDRSNTAGKTSSALNWIKKIFISED